MNSQTNGPLLNLNSPFDDPVRHTLFSLVKKPLSKMLRLETLNSLYSELHKNESAEPFVQRALDKLGIQFSIDGQPVSRIPKTGPLMAVCNHPFGIIEGLLLVNILRTVRTDIKIMANFMLSKIPELEDLIVEVDPFRKTESKTKNINGLRQSMQWLKQGGMLIVFPAGEVSSIKVNKRMVADPQWSPMVGRIIRKTGANVLPVFFEGRNSGLFQTLGMIHPSLRTVMLPHENLRTASKGTIRVAFGSIIDGAKRAVDSSDEELIDYLRFRTYLLRKENKSNFTFAPREKKRKLAPIANSRGKHILASEVASLPDEAVLIESGDFTVFQASAFQIPRIIREIGIQREATFRLVGEGTGRPMDIDAFDDTYRHLVLWNRKEREAAGAYRFGLTDEILKEHGAQGLYTSTLFDYDPGMLESMGPALEMGRSFIISKYQKNYQPLLLLWKGVAEFIVQNPKYTKLFGCVSISGEYSGISRELIVGFLQRHCSLPELANMAHPKTPPKNRRLNKVDFTLPANAFSDPEDITAMVSDVEGGTSIPVLLRQYLKLGGKIIGFNVDPDFGDCLDGLILVDLLQSDPKVLGRFMGKSNVKSFLETHRANRKPQLTVIETAA